MLEEIVYSLEFKEPLLLPSNYFLENDPKLLVSCGCNYIEA